MNEAIKEIIGRLRTLDNESENDPSMSARRSILVKRLCMLLNQDDPEYSKFSSTVAAQLHDACAQNDTARIRKLINDYTSACELTELVKKERPKVPSKDVFISHSSGDQEALVDELYSTLTKMHKDVVPIYYYKHRDEAEWGLELMQDLKKNCLGSRFAIIVFSKNFFNSSRNSKYTEYELKLFLAMQRVSKQPVILPVLYGVTWDEVKERYADLFFESAFGGEPLYKVAGDENGLKPGILSDIALEFASLLIAALKQNN